MPDQTLLLSCVMPKWTVYSRLRENGLTIFLYVNGRYGTYSTNRLDKKELETFIKNGIDSTRYLAKDEARVLPDASRYYKGGSPDLKLLDAEFSSHVPMIK